MRKLWRRRDDRLEPIAAATDIGPRTETELYVRVLAQVLSPSDGSGCGIGAIGIVEKAGADAVGHLGQRVIVPATIPDSEERDAPLRALQQPELGDATVTSHLLCPARWALPLEEGLELELPLGAIAARELVEAYALLMESHATPRSLAVIVGDGTRAQLCTQLAAQRECQVLELSTPAMLAAIDPASDARFRQRAHVMIASDDSHLLDAGSRWITKLERPSVAVYSKTSAGALALGEIAACGARIAGVRGAHPDLLIDVVAMVVKGEIELAKAAETRQLDDTLGSSTYAISVSE